MPIDHGSDCPAFFKGEAERATGVERVTAEPPPRNLKQGRKPYESNPSPRFHYRVHFPCASIRVLLHVRRPKTDNGPPLGP